MRTLSCMVLEGKCLESENESIQGIEIGLAIGILPPKALDFPLSGRPPETIAPPTSTYLSPMESQDRSNIWSVFSSINKLLQPRPAPYSFESPDSC